MTEVHKLPNKSDNPVDSYVDQTAKELFKNADVIYTDERSKDLVFQEMDELLEQESPQYQI